jgi:hypothetical protein
MVSFLWQMIAPLLKDEIAKLENAPKDDEKDQENSSSSTNLKEAKFEERDEDERIVKLQVQFLRCSLVLGCIDEAVKTI